MPAPIICSPSKPTSRAEVESDFADAPQNQLDSHSATDKGHGRIEERTVTVSAETAWRAGERHFPGEFRLPQVKSSVRAACRSHLKDRCRFETRYFIASRRLSAAAAAHAVRGHGAIENSLHWTRDAVFQDDQRRNRKGHGALNMAIVRHFAFNLVRALPTSAPSKSPKAGRLEYPLLGGNPRRQPPSTGIRSPD